MSFWNDIVTRIGRTKPPTSTQGVYAATFPTYDVATPQYPNPNPYPLAITGYRKNEIIYACIQKRAIAKAEASLWVWKDSDDTPEEQDDHALLELLRHPNERTSEHDFWMITSIYQDIAGFAAWEIERNKLGEPIGLWSMRPDWCSFYRGENRPIRAVRYQPYGLPPLDIAIEDVLLFSEFDPIFPLIKFLSKSAVASRIVSVDNAATDHLTNFFQHGTVVPAVLKTVQSITDAEAQRVRARWTEAHGGVANWSAPAVLGAGLEYQQLTMNFKDMAFAEIDGRSEARICAVFSIPPMLLGAKVGLAASTYSNYAEARKAWYEESLIPEWTGLAQTLGHQLLPQWNGDPELYCEFDLSNIRALQEDRTARWTRAQLAFEKNIVTRDEAREEMDLDPIDDEDIFFVEASKGAQSDIPASSLFGTPQPGVTPPQLRPFVDRVQSQDDTAVKPVEPVAPIEATDAEKELETKQYKSWRKRGAKQGKPFVFKHLNETERTALMRPFVVRRSQIIRDSVKAAPTAERMKREAILRDKIAQVLARHEQAAIDAIRNKQIPDLGALQSEMRSLVERELADAAAAEMERQSLAVGVEYDPTDIDIAAHEWARGYSYELVRGITDKTRTALSGATTRYTEAGGMTIGDLKQLLAPIYGAVRADKIAVTETTRAYAQAQSIYQDMIRREGVIMVRVWNTDNDDLVCPICAPLNGKTEDEWGGEEPPSHPNCRCFISLVMEKKKR